jgi:RNA polymerase sigma-70 factor (ECF subfamily)
VTPGPERRDQFAAVAAEVYEPLQRYLRRRAAPDDADDALGDVLLTVWRRLDDVPQDAVLPWCYGVARRVLANQRRSARRRLRLIERLEATRAPAPAPDPLESRLDPGLAAALATLRHTDREVLAMWAWEQLEPREIAVALGISPNAAALRLSRARKRLAAALGQEDDPSGHNASEHTEDRHG